jgi:hypothetical protein
MAYQPIEVANEFIARFGQGSAIDHMKLQKLLYFTNGWYLGLAGRSLLSENPQVWRYGPVFRWVYNAFSRFGVSMAEKQASNSPMKPTHSGPLGRESQPPITTLSPSEPKYRRSKIGSIFQNLLRLGGGTPRRSRVRLRLDQTPTGAEEYEDFEDQNSLMGLYDEDDAKLRIDKLARRLALGWTAFLMYIVLAQGNADGTVISICGWTIPVMPRFNLESGEFIAVFTTTTASVFGFLVIVANYLFKRA